MGGAKGPFVTLEGLGQARKQIPSRRAGEPPPDQEVEDQTKDPERWLVAAFEDDPRLTMRSDAEANDPGEVGQPPAIGLPAEVNRLAAAAVLGGIEVQTEAQPHPAAQRNRERNADLKRFLLKAAEETFRIFGRDRHGAIGDVPREDVGAHAPEPTETVWRPREGRVKAAFTSSGIGSA